MKRGRQIQSLHQYLNNFEDGTPPAIIMGPYATSNLGVIHNLAAHHIPSIVIDARRQCSFFSRYALGLLSPNPSQSVDDYLEFLLDLGRSLPGKAVLFPTADTETLILSQHHDRLTPHFHSTSALYELLNVLINKQSLFELLERYQIPHPATYIVDPGSDLGKISKQIPYPCILKPCYPAQFRLDFPTKAFQASSPEQFLSLVQKITAKGHELIAQEIIPGTAESMFGFNAYYDKHGDVHGQFIYQRIREWPLGFGNGCYLRQVHEPQLEEMTTKLIKPLGYHGIVDVEFRRDARDGQMKLIEINPRIWMQNRFPGYLGYNHPYLAYRDALDLPLQPSMSLEDSSLHWVFGAEDLQSGLAGVRQGTLPIKEWLTTYLRPNLYATFSRNDPFPWVIAAYRSFIWSCSLTLHRQKGKGDGRTQEII
jgi:D-aspartate ligase